MSRKHVDHADIDRFAAERVNLPKDKVTSTARRFAVCASGLKGIWRSTPTSA
jgi:hypothetical protein